MKGLSGSLSFRILLIEAAFLLIPLIFFAFLLYVEDSRVKARDNQAALELISKSKEELIQEMLIGEREFINLLQRVHPPLQSLKNKGIFYLKHQESRYLCTKAVDQSFVGKDFTSIIPSRLEEEGVFVGNSETDRFYFVKPFSDGEEIWAIAFSDKQLTDKLAIEKDIPYQTIVSLISQDGTVLLSTNEKWQHQPVPRSKLRENGFSLNGESFISRAEKVRGSNLTLMAAAPRKANLVEMPYFFAKMGVLLLIILVIGGGATLWLISRLSKPLQKLCRVMQQVGEGDLKARYEPDKMGFEMNIVGTILNQTVESMVEYMEKIKEERVAKETLEKEFMIGQEVQKSILPKKLPEFPGLDIAARFLSAKEVGGDFYDFLVRQEGEERRLFFSIADTAGKGIYACLYSLTLRSILRSYGEIHHDLGKIIREANNLFCLDTGDSGVFVTAWLAFFDEKSRKLHFSNCGHFPALLMRANGTLEKLTTEGMALGVEPFGLIATHSVVLEKGDTLLLFTDGVVEACSKTSEMFGERRLIDSFMKKGHLKAEKIVDKIIEEVTLFAEGAPQYDDLTLVVLKSE